MPQDLTPGEHARQDELLDQIRHKFANCLEGLRPQLINIARKHHGLGRDDAEDSIHNAWLRCERHVERLRDVRSPEAWIKNTFNLCCRDRRDELGRKRTGGDQDGGILDDAPASFDTLLYKLGRHHGPRASHEYHIDECDETLWDTVRSLPHRQMLAVLHRFIMGESYEQIAAIMQCEPATVRSLVRHALPAMKKNYRLHTTVPSLVLPHNN